MRYLPQIIVIVILLLHLNRYSSQYHCPCDDPSSWNLEYHNYPSQRNLSSSDPLTLCIDLTHLNNHHMLSMFQRVLSSQSAFISLHEDFAIRVIPAAAAVLVEHVESSCNAVIHLYDAYNDALARSKLCPGICRPVPDRHVYAQSLLNQHDLHSQQHHIREEGRHHHQSNKVNSLRMYSQESDAYGHLRVDDYPITCSLTRAMLMESTTNLADVARSRGVILHNRLKTIFWRMIMECYEKKHWYHRYAKTQMDAETSQGISLSRRKVESVVIWIGNQEHISLVESQALLLRDESSEGARPVIAWAATDETFSCNPSETTCVMTSRRGREFIPRSTINQYNVGWRCAQRRPIRALSHILLLFEPTFVVLGDDDTLVNYPLLVQRFNHTLYDSMLKEPIVLGELTGAEGDTGHLTRKGFYAGGAGYILGRRLLEVLVGHEIKYWKESDNHGLGRDLILFQGDNYRSQAQIMGLSVVADLIPKLQYCSSDKTCLTINPRPRLPIGEPSYK
jgi:hypothetical protein